MNNLAISLWHSGEKVAANNLMNLAVGGSVAKLGTGHPDTRQRKITRDNMRAALDAAFNSPTPTP